MVDVCTYEANQQLQQRVRRHVCRCEWRGGSDIVFICTDKLSLSLDQCEKHGAMTGSVLCALSCTSEEIGDKREMMTSTTKTYYNPHKFPLTVSGGFEL